MCFKLMALIRANNWLARTFYLLKVGYCHDSLDVKEDSTRAEVHTRALVREEEEQQIIDCSGRARR